MFRIRGVQLPGRGLYTIALTRIGFIKWRGEFTVRMAKTHFLVEP